MNESPEAKKPQSGAARRCGGRRLWLWLWREEDVAVVVADVNASCSLLIKGCILTYMRWVYDINNTVSFRIMHVITDYDVYRNISCVHCELLL